MMSFLQKLFFKKLVATDEFDNRYYQQGKSRWVEYSKMKDPSVVPPLYYLWLHGSIDSIKNISSHKKYEWERLKMPNLTGTDAAYLPTHHILKDSSQNHTLDYAPWNPGDE